MWKGVLAKRVISAFAMAQAISTTLADNVFNDNITLPIPEDLGGLSRDFTVFELPAQPSLLKGQSEDVQGQMMTGMRTRNHMPKVTKTQKAEARKDLRRRGKRGKTPKRRPRPPRPTQNRPGPQNRPPRPPPQNSPSRSSGCVSVSTYESIDKDVDDIKQSLRNDKDKSHFLGGILRLAAHDFMDFDRRDQRDKMGPDGCYDTSHANNDGLETIWCRTCPLRELYNRKYSHISRADYWIASANAVVRITSINNALDLKDTFMWGRKDRDSCRGSGERLPRPSGCDEVEDVFLRNMGLTWGDAVALLGAHTIGRGDRSFSGHEGTWVATDKDAMVFDKQYYEELFTNAWRPRANGGRQDWTTGRGHGNTRMMLNTDMCLVFDIDETIQRQMPCCTRTNSHDSNGQNECVDREAAMRRCPMYSKFSQRREATDAVRDMLGGSITSRNNSPFYIAFAKAWRKATTLGQNSLSPLRDSCD